MDRLPAVIVAAAVVATVGCNEGAEARPVSLSRVNAAKRKAAPAKVEPIAEFCDVYATPDDAVPFSYPKLVDAAPTSRGWSWINLWATWCEPCIEEMPMLLEWHKRLGAAGTRVSLSFLSVDEEAEAVAKFRQLNPTLPKGPRVKDPGALEPWLVSLGLDGGAAIPINIFVDGEMNIRCVRTGALAERHYETIARLMR